MWIDLYLVAAFVVALAAWFVSPHFPSYDPPSDVARGFWSIIAGALWPLILVGAAQIYAVLYVTRRLRPDHSEELNPAPALEMCEPGVRS